MPRFLRSVLVLSAAFTVGGTAVAVVPAAVGAATSHAATAHKKKKKVAGPPKPVTLAPGAVVRYYDVKINSRQKARTALLRLDLRNARIRLGAATPGNAVGAPRQTITTLTRANHAIAGINADFFKSGYPLGGLVIDGRMLKSPRKNWDANFYLRRGRAHVGPVNFTGKIVRAARPVPQPAPEPPPLLPILFPPTTKPTPPPIPATSRTLSSINTVRDLGSDRIVLVNSALATPRFGRACTVVTAARTSTGSVVTAVVKKVKSVSRLTGTHFALVACGSGPRAKWLRTKVIKGDKLKVSTSLAGGSPSALVSGGRVLVKKGRAFDDSDGKTVKGRNPETFACVSRDGAKIILGTIDGRRPGSAGATLPELTRYMLRLKCWSGIVFDGGGSSTLVGKPYNRSAVRVLNRPSDRGGARAVTTGLLLYRR